MFQAPKSLAGIVFLSANIIRVFTTSKGVVKAAELPPKIKSIMDIKYNCF